MSKCISRYPISLFRFSRSSDTFCLFVLISGLMCRMKIIKRIILVLCAVILAVLIFLSFYSLGGPRGVPLQRMIPPGAPLCLAVMDLDARWPEVASSGLWKRLVELELVPERRNFFQRFFGREAVAFYSKRSGLCVASRLSAWQRGVELPWRLWMLATGGDWTRERFRGLDLIRVEQRKDRPAFMYFVYGDLGFLMIGADFPRMKDMAELLLGGGGREAEAFESYSLNHFISLYLRPDKLMEFDLRGEYEKAGERYTEEYLPPCWAAVEGINRALTESGMRSIFDVYSEVASSLDENEAIVASLDMGVGDAVLEWRRIGAEESKTGGAGLMRYAAVLPDNVIAASAFRFDTAGRSGGVPFPVGITPVEEAVGEAFDEKTEGILSSLEGSAVLAIGRPSLFSSLVPACAIFRLKSPADITSRVNSLLDTIAGREVEVSYPGFASRNIESKAGHRRKSHGGCEYFILEKSGPFVWSYAQLGDLLIIATHKNFLKSVIDAEGRRLPVLSSSKSFTGVVGTLTGRGEVEGFLDVNTLSSYAGTALAAYALREALLSPGPSEDEDPFAPLRTALEVLGCFGTVAWESGADGGRVVIPINTGNQKPNIIK